MNTIKVISRFEGTASDSCTHKNIDENKGICIECGKHFDCLHCNITQEDNGLHVCQDCGIEIELQDHEAEWRGYHASGTNNPARCHRTKFDDRGLSKVFDKHKIKIEESIAAQILVKYNTIVGKTTVRGNGREAIIAACLFYVYIERGEYRTSEYIRTLFDLDKSSMSKGMKKYEEKFPGVRNLVITPTDLIKWLLNLTGIDQKYYHKIVKIAKLFNNKSRDFQRSSPQSVASAYIYFYLKSNAELDSKLKMNINDFAESVYLSSITIDKLVKEVYKIKDIYGLSKDLNKL